MAEHGGYRRPEHPAPTSPPGAMSQRTDGGPADTQPMRPQSDGSYGDRKDLTQIQSGAPQAGNPTPALDSRDQVVPMGAPTQNPDQPVTDGAALGAGTGPNGAGIETNANSQDLTALKDILPALEYIANGPTGSPSARAYIRSLKGGA